MNEFLSMKKWQYAAIAVLLTGFFIFWMLWADRNYKVSDGIPSQTAVLLEFNGFLQVITQEGAQEKRPALLSDLSIFRSATAGAGMMNRLFARHAKVMDAIKNRPLATAFSLQPTDSLHGLFILDLGENIAPQTVIAAIPGAQKVFSYTFKDQELFTLHLSGGEKFVLAVKRNILLFSRFSYLVEDALIQLDNRKSWWTKHPFGVMPGVQFRLTVRSEMLAERLQGQMESLWAQLPDWVTQKTQWFSFFQKEGGGWSVSAGMQEALPSAGNQQDINQLPLFSILPDNTALLAWAGLGGSGSLSGYFTSKIDDSDFDQFIEPWSGNEIACATVEPYSAGMLEDQFLIIEIRDSVLARLKLQEYGAQRGLLKQYDYQTFEVNQFLSQSLIAPLTGSRGGGFQNPACVIVGGYAVFAATNSSIELLIDKYIVNQTLNNSPDFLQLQKKRTQQGDVFLYLNTSYLPLIVKNVFAFPLHADFEEDVQAVQRAGMVSVDFDAKKEKEIVGNLARQTVGASSAGASILWKTTISGQVTGTPSVVRLKDAHAEPAILVQDDQHQLYRFSTGGSVLWRKQIGKTILSAIHGVDFYKNGGLYYLFNTSDAIWVLDDEGHEVEGFPLKLQSPATNGILVVDFHNTQAYSLFIACENGNLYGFDQYGRPISGWNPKSRVGQVSFPLIHFKSENNDFLAALSNEGRLAVFNRNGSPHFTPLDFSGTFNNCPLQYDDHPGTPRVVCMNTDGRVFGSNLKGASFGLDLCAGVKATPFLVFKDLAADNRKDFAMVRGTNFCLSAYEGAQLKSIQNKTFPSAQDTLFDAGCCGMLGTLDKAKRRIYLLDKGGNLHPGFPLAGTTPFVLNQIFTSREEHILIVGNGNALYAYKVN